MKITSLLVLGFGLAVAAGAGLLWAAQPPPALSSAPDVQPSMAGRTLITRAEIEELAKSGKVWCQDWRTADQSCGGVAFLDLMPDGTIRETVWFQLSESPDVQIGLRDTVSFEGDALCSVNDSRRTTTSVLISGRPAGAVMGSLYSQLIQRQLQSDDGKHSCESFFHDASGAGMLSIVTTDGARDTKLDSAYRLLDKGAKIGLRAGGPDPVIA